ncbi:MAG: hypothetical protein ACE5LG_07955 [Anaerolineae bacterium]
MDERFLIDFGVFMQAVADLAAGLNPYAREGFFSPPWLFYLLSPFSLLPTQIGATAWFMMSLGTLVACISSVSTKHRYRLLWITALAISPIVWPYVLFGNIIGLVGIGLVGLFNWKRSWLAVPLVLLKPQLSLVAMVMWVLRSGWKQVAKASGLLVILNLPLFIWKPSLYRDFLYKSVSGQYLETQSHHIAAATSWLPFGSVIWVASSATLIAILLLLSLWAKNKRVTFLSTILADPVAGGGEYALLAVAAAMGDLDRRNLAVAVVTVFALPFISIFVRRGNMLAPLATAILLAWAIYSRTENKPAPNARGRIRGSGDSRHDLRKA